MAYKIPTAKNGVYFTKNLNSSTRANGENVLGYYWRASVLSKAPYYPLGANWQSLLSYYDTNYPTFIEYLGDMVSSSSISKMIKVAQNVAAKKSTDYPRPSEFANEISNVVGSVNYLGAIGDGLVESANDIKNISIGYLSTLAVVGVIIFGVVIYQKSGGKINLPKWAKL